MKTADLISIERFKSIQTRSTMKAINSNMIDSSFYGFFEEIHTAAVLFYWKIHNNSLFDDVMTFIDSQLL